MPNKQLGQFLNSMPGLWTICAIILVLVLLGRLATKKALAREYRSQFSVILTLGLTSVVLLALTWWFPVRGQIPASVVPRIWILGIYACLAYLVSKILRRTEDPDPVDGDLALTFKFIAVCVAYIAFMVVVGYFAASLAFLIAAMALLSYRRRLVILGVGVGWMAFSYLVFYRLLFVPLPRGLLISAIFG